MSVYIHYQAMPEQSRLFQRLSAELRLYTLYTRSLHQPAGPYEAISMPLGEYNDLFDDLAKNPTFGSRSVVDQVMADLTAELKDAALMYPGLPERSAYIKLIDIEERLGDALDRLGIPDACDLASEIVMGGESIAPAGFKREDLRYFKASFIQEVTAPLQTIDLSDLGDEQELFLELRHVYVSAAERGEGIVIG